MTQILPHLDDIAIHVPVSRSSITEYTVDFNADITESDTNAAFRATADGTLVGVLGYTDNEIPSSDGLDVPFGSYVDL